MTLFFGFIAGLIVTIMFPAQISLILIIANMFLPDPIPYADELGQIAGLIMRME